MLDRYDVEQLKKAKEIVDAVYNYNFGSAPDRKIVARLDTISKKIGVIIDQESAKNQ